MRSELLHLYGPFAINSYGLFIALGTLIFVELLKRDPRFAHLGIGDRLVNIVILSGIVGLLGGRILFMLLAGQLSWRLYELFYFWDGGFSVLGGIISLLIFLPLYLWCRKISILETGDVAAIYAPLLLAISRIGCFFAGCCYGKPTDCAWGICYTDRTSFAPLNVRLHPTQLYSAALLFFTFLLFYLVLRKILKKPGQLFMLFLIAHSAERFIIDFWRADRPLVIPFLSISIHQCIALAIIAVGVTGLIITSRRTHIEPHEYL